MRYAVRGCQQWCCRPKAMGMMWCEGLWMNGRKQAVKGEVGDWKATTSNTSAEKKRKKTGVHSWREGSSNGSETAAAADRISA